MQTPRSRVSFPDDISDAVGKLDLYVNHKLARTRQGHDTVFHGDLSNVMLNLHRLDADNLAMGFTGTIAFYVDPDANPGPEGFAPGGPGHPPPQGDF